MNLQLLVPTSNSQAQVFFLFFPPKKRKTGQIGVDTYSPQISPEKIGKNFDYRMHIDPNAETEMESLPERM
jgi:hypothetical protein